LPHLRAGVPNTGGAFEASDGCARGRRSRPRSRTEGGGDRRGSSSCSHDSARFPRYGPRHLRSVHILEALPLRGTPTAPSRRYPRPLLRQGARPDSIPEAAPGRLLSCRLSLACGPSSIATSAGMPCRLDHYGETDVLIHDPSDDTHQVVRHNRERSHVLRAHSQTMPSPFMRRVNTGCPWIETQKDFTVLTPNAS
jgi:hypothetical protein